MLSFLVGAPRRVRWQLAQPEPDGPCRLFVHHPGGVSVESFASAWMAVRRVQELEDLLDTAKLLGNLCPVGLPS